MLDVEMLELIGRPGGYSLTMPQGAELPPALEEVFQRIVRDGWAPRDPAAERDLDRLEAFTTRGHCLEPLVMEGDVVYIDHTAKPQPGTIVSFALSERMAAAQNADLPAFDAKPCKPGDRWLKLFVPYCGIAMLHERYNHAFTATFAACENPDDVPVLAPVRQIRRDGRLLFPPLIHGAQVSDNAVSQIVSNFSAGAVNTSASQALGTNPTDAAIISASIVSTGSPIAVDVGTAVSLSGGASPSSSFTSATIQVYRDGASIGSAVWDGTTLGNQIATGPVYQITLSVTDPAPAASHTYSLHVHVACTTGPIASVTMTNSNNFIKVREIKR